MVDQDNLKEVYERELKPKLQVLDALRKKVVRRQLLVLLCIVLLAGWFLSGTIETQPVVFWILFAVLVGGAIYFGVKAGSMWRDYRGRYKEEVVREIVRLIDPEWTYAPDQMISPHEYQQSDLFRRSYDRYRGDDLISGTLDKTDFRCSELHTEYRDVSYDKDGKRKERWVTIFRGLLFHADFNKHIKGQTYIEPDTAERLFGKWGQKFQMSSKGKLVKLEDRDFEKLFAVYATDQTEARYILTPAIMEALVNIRKQFGRKMHLSFIGARVFVALHFSKSLFEPRMYSSCLRFEDVSFMHALFMMNAIIIKELNLNTRIWTKE